MNTSINGSLVALLKDTPDLPFHTVRRITEFPYERDNYVIREGVLLTPHEVESVEITPNEQGFAMPLNLKKQMFAKQMKMIKEQTAEKTCTSAKGIAKPLVM